LRPGSEKVGQRNAPAGAHSRWRRQQEFVPIPPAPNARIITPSPDPWYDEVEVYQPIIPTPDQERGTVVTEVTFIGTPSEQQVNEATERGFISAEDRSRLLRIRQNQARTRRGMVPYPGRLRPDAREITVEFDESSSRIQGRAVERPRGYWKLRNGKFIDISSMDNEHLGNCIRMCERNANSRGRRADAGIPGVYQELCQERELRLRSVREELARTEFYGRIVQLPSTLIPFVSFINEQVPLDTQPAIQQEPDLAPGVLPEGAPKRRIKS